MDQELTIDTAVLNSIDDLTSQQYHTLLRSFDEEFIGVNGNVYELDNDFFDFIYSSINNLEWYDQMDSEIQQSDYEIKKLLSNYKIRKSILNKSNNLINSKIIMSFNNENNNNGGGNKDGKFMDLQGLVWENKYQRFKFINQRLKMFKSYTHLSNSIRSASKDLDFKLRQVNHTLFEFKSFFTVPKPKLIHFQLRNLITVINKDEIYYSIQNENQNQSNTNSTNNNDDDNNSNNNNNDDNNSNNNNDETRHNFEIMKLNTKLNTIEPIVKLNNDFKISTLSSSANTHNSNFINAGSFNGSILIHNLKLQQNQYCKLTNDSNGITNYILASRFNNQNNDLVIASNDKYIRYYDTFENKIFNELRFDYPINCISENPNNFNELLLVGDSQSSIIVDRRIQQTNNNIVETFKHHYDYSFSCDWNDHNLIATGNQDGSIRLYDRRKLGNSLMNLSGFLNGAVRNLKFNNNNNKSILSFAESIDNVYLVDLDHCLRNVSSESKMKDPLQHSSLNVNKTKKQLQRLNDNVNSYYYSSNDLQYQNISFFGKVTGLSFNPSNDEFNEVLTVGISDNSTGGILQYELNDFENDLGEGNNVDWL